MSWLEIIYIYIDTWSGYNFLSQNNSGFLHFQYNHSIGQFGNTSKIESVWGELKFLIIKISKNFIYFLIEGENRRTLKNLSKDDKLFNFSIALSCFGNGKNGNFLSDDELKMIDYETLFGD